MLFRSLGAFATVARAFAAQSAPQSGAVAGPLTIEQAVQIALSRNDGLKATEQRVRESEAGVAEARAGFLPSVNLNFAYTPSQASPLLRIPAGAFGPTEQTFRANFVRENVMRVDLQQPVYTGGRLEHALGAQLATREVARLGVERTRQTLTLRVYETFYAALMNEQGLRVNEEGVQIATRHLELARARFDAGTAARLDVLRAEVELANARARLIRARSASDVSVQALRTVLALRPEEALTLSGTLNELPAIPMRPALDTAIEARPDLRAFGEQRTAAQHGIALASASLKPTLAFTGNLQYQEDGLSNLLEGTNRSYQLGLSFGVPLFNRPRAAAQRAAATARVREVEFGARAALDGARLELASAITEYESAREIVSTEEKAVELARESLAIAEVSYENGVITATELNDARLSLLQTEWELTQARYSEIVAAARTRYAAGL